MMKILFVMLALVLCACNLEPPYKPAGVCIPTEWKGCECKEPKIVCGPYWWNVFEDSTLNLLEEQAVKSNQDVYVALQRVAEARAIAGVDKSALFPQLTLDPSYNNSAQLFKLLFPVTLPIPNVFRVHQVWYEMPLNLAWEIDLWGKLRNQYKSARIIAEAQEEALCATLLTLTADVATSYYQVRTFDAQICILNETIAINKKEVELIQNRFDKGLIGALDLEQAKLLLTNVEASYYDTVRLRKLEENKIAIYLGIPASCFCIQPRPLIGCPPCIPAGIPSKVLCRRPDIRQQERNMASQHALIGVAYASFFPSLTLTGTLGSLSPDLHNFMTWNSRYWYYGANISQSIFDAGRNLDNLDASWARFNESSGTYRQTVLVAFKEVEDALNNLDMERKQGMSLEASLKAAENVTRLTRNRYKKGLTNYLDVFIAERNELDAKTNVNNIQGLRFISTIQLIKAIGGSLETRPEKECCSR